MRLDVFKGFEFVGMVLDYDTLQISRKFAEAGSLELKINNFDNVEELQEDNIICCGTDAYIIENVHQTTNSAQEKVLEITGNHIKYLLDRRITKGIVINTTETIEMQLLNLVKDNCINTNIQARVIDGFRVKSNNINIRANKQYVVDNVKGISVYEIVKEICTVFGLGWHIDFLPEENAFVFYIMRHIDITDNVVFGEEYGNVAQTEFYKQSNNYKNVSYISGSYSGIATGLDRREVAIDKLEDMEKYKRLISSETIVIDLEQFKYKYDWDLGNVVAIENKELGFYSYLSIMEIKETHGRVMEIDVVFGDKIPTIFDKLKEKR